MFYSFKTSVGSLTDVPFLNKEKFPLDFFPQVRYKQFVRYNVPVINITCKYYISNRTEKVIHRARDYHKRLFLEAWHSE